MTDSHAPSVGPLCKRFRGFLPVIVDVETGGFNPNTDALLEIAVVVIEQNDQGRFVPGATHHEHVEPFAGANLDPKALAFTGIIPDHPLRFAKAEKDALQAIFGPIKQAIQQTNCQRAVLVGHNAQFDLSFLQAAIERTQVKSPFHRFTTLDTATLSALAVGHTVLAKSCQLAGIPFDGKQAHSALYDALRTADLFCHIVNRWDTNDNNLA